MILGNRFFAGVLVGIVVLITALYLYERWAAWP